jgi:hypothetical protein
MLRKFYIYQYFSFIGSFCFIKKPNEKTTGKTQAQCQLRIMNHMPYHQQEFFAKPKT